MNCRGEIGTVADCSTQALNSLSSFVESIQYFLLIQYLGGTFEQIFQNENCRFIRARRNTDDETQKETKSLVKS
ncbi:hypothetical protein E2986_12811 [Frieseomelitta varia]|uniref:Uncharacterized protein n=1 Tax=Frieseomelitta varia TaxID=561572 RepID=A0A833S107_9HYME|nr:hypothetical protein E2986_12811 [Frieseomelitta varia]